MTLQMLSDIHTFLMPAFYADSMPWMAALSLGLLSLLLEDVALLLGAAVSHQNPDLLPAVFVGLLIGIFSGDVMLYAGGRWLQGISAIKRALAAPRMHRALGVFKGNATFALVVCRAIPSSRLPTFVAAGAVKLPFYFFASVVFFTGLIWTLSILLLGKNILNFIHEELNISTAWILLPVACLLVWPLILRNKGVSDAG